MTTLTSGRSLGQMESWGSGDSTEGPNARELLVWARAAPCGWMAPDTQERMPTMRQQTFIALRIACVALGCLHASRCNGRVAFHTLLFNTACSCSRVAW